MTETRKPGIFRLQDVAEVLGVPVKAARRMCEAGVIPSRKLGGRIVVLPDELDAHLHSLPQRRSCDS